MPRTHSNCPVKFDQSYLAYISVYTHKNNNSIPKLQLFIFILLVTEKKNEKQFGFFFINLCDI